VAGGRVVGDRFDVEDREFGDGGGRFFAGAA